VKKLQLRKPKELPKMQKRKQLKNLSVKKSLIRKNSKKKPIKRKKKIRLRSNKPINLPPKKICPAHKKLN